MREPPPKGSLRESVLMLYVLKKEMVEHARLRALAQSIVAKDKGVEAFDDYQKVAFPWFETQKKREKLDHLKLLFEEVKRGGLAVTPMAEKPMRSRLKTRVIEREAQRDDKSMNDLYSKLGMVVPVR
jgi:hypothetical protein